MNCGLHEVCDGLVYCCQRSSDTSTIVAQLSEHNNVLKNQLREICVNEWHKVLHSLAKSTAKEHVLNDKKDETELKTDHNENNTIKSGESESDSNEEVKCDNGSEKHEKLNERSKPV